MSHEHPIAALCPLLGVSRSGYYAWRAAQQNPGPRAAANRTLAQALEKQFQRSRGTYGSPRLTQALRRCGHRCGRHRVARLMRQMQLVARPRRRFRPQTTDSRHAHPVAPNRLAQRGAPTAANQVWVADLTYLATAEGWLYLAAIMDLYSRRIVGWAFSDSLASGLVLAALRMALQHRRPPRDLLLHSDRGVQYACGAHRAELERHGLVASMSRAGNCYDNAAMESFWSSLKTELPLESGGSRLRVQAAVFDYIECFYNRERLHSALGYKSPVDFENSNQ
jgi:transposase InsO family protein